MLLYAYLALFLEVATASPAIFSANATALVDTQNNQTLIQRDDRNHCNTKIINRLTSCHDKGHHATGGAPCAELHGLINSFGDKFIPLSPQHICYKRDGGPGKATRTLDSQVQVQSDIFNPRGKCCLSWDHPLPGMKYSSLARLVKDVVDACDKGDIKWTGTVYGANSLHECVSFCVSNRPDHCDWKRSV